MGDINRARAWLVVGDDGHEAVFKDQPTAERYAVRVRGIVYPLFLGRRREDDLPGDKG